MFLHGFTLIFENITHPAESHQNIKKEDTKVNLKLENLILCGLPGIFSPE